MTENPAMPGSSFRLSHRRSGWAKGVGLIILAMAVVNTRNALALDDPATPPNAAVASDLESRIAAARTFGPYGVERIRERDGLRNGPKYAGATIYYPVIKAVDGDQDPSVQGGEEDAVDDEIAEDKVKTPALTGLSSVVLIPGFMGPERSMSRWGPYLASHGIVVMTIGTNNLGVNPDARGEALVDGLVTIRAENEREGSPLLGRLDPESVAVGGWSMGGGGAQVAATLDPSIKAVLALCPWKPRPYLSHDVPVFFLGGERDGPAPVKKHALNHYDALPDRTPKLLYEVRGGGHSLPLNPKYAAGDVGRFSLAWLKVYLDDDDSWRPILEARPDNASRFLIELPEAEEAEATEDDRESDKVKKAA